MARRVYDPDEEIPFHFTANEINAIIAMVETTMTYPLRVTAPLREKILQQINAEPLDAPLVSADGRDEAGPLVVESIATGPRRAPRKAN